MAKDPSFGVLLRRVCSTNALECWQGYLYYKNDTKYNLKQTLTMNLEGLDIINKDFS